MMINFLAFLCMLAPWQDTDHANRGNLQAAMDLERIQPYRAFYKLKNGDQQVGTCTVELTRFKIATESMQSTVDGWRVLFTLRYPSADFVDLMFLDASLRPVLQFVPSQGQNGNLAFQVNRWKGQGRKTATIDAISWDVKREHIDFQREYDAHGVPTMVLATLPLAIGFQTDLALAWDREVIETTVEITKKVTVKVAGNALDGWLAQLKGGPLDSTLTVATSPPYLLRMEQGQSGLAWELISFETLPH